MHQDDFFGIDYRLMVDMHCAKTQDEISAMVKMAQNYINRVSGQQIRRHREGAQRRRESNNFIGD